MEIKQFYDKNLAHASYAVMSDDEAAIIDPARDPHQYYEFADKNNAKIVAVIETHPHADFVSSHLEISKTTGAKIYVSKLLGAYYDHITFDEGDELKLGKIKLLAINTPGHSPDSISVLIKDENGNDYAIATGDTLFVGDVGRPDLRESAGSIQSKKEELARMMFKTIREKFLKLPDSMLVYPAHGAGSLCGKSSSTDTYTTIGKERKQNYALQPMSEDNFVHELLKDQPFIPKYFSHDVELNRNGAPDFQESVDKVKKIDSYDDIENGALIIDTRSKEEFSEGHYKGTINIPIGTKFETWLGSVVSPNEKFYLIAKNNSELDNMIQRTAKIGYEQNIEGALVHEDIAELEQSDEINLEDFRNNPDSYTILDVRNESEVKNKKIFKDSHSIPLYELRERLSEIPVDKPIVVHCEGGYRSGIASSILSKHLSAEIYDLGDHIRNFSSN